MTFEQLGEEGSTRVSKLLPIMNELDALVDRVEKQVAESREVQLAAAAG